MKKQTKLVAILSASALLALGASMTSMAATGWTEENGVWQFISRDGYPVTEEWKRSGNNYYWLDENGEMAVNVLVDSGEGKYFVDETGARVINNWRQVDNVDGWINGDNGDEPNTIWYYFGSSGKANTGRKTINGKVYIFDTEGEMFTGWKEHNDKTYYLGEENEGWAHTGWINLEIRNELAGEYDADDGWFNFKSSGEMRKSDAVGKTARAYIGGAYYGFDHNGVMVDGWMPPKDSTSTSAVFYAKESGEQKTGWVNTYKNTEEGEDESTVWFYLNSKGKPFNVGGYWSDEAKEDTRSLGNAQCYEDGRPTDKLTSQVAAKVINSKTYLFDNTGKMLTGVYKIGDENVKRVGGSGDLAAGAFYYFNLNSGSVNGQMATGKTTVTFDGESYYYYFQKNGQAYTNMIVDNALYKANGTRLSSDESREIYRLTEDDVSGEVRVSNNAAIKLEAGDRVAVSSSGALRKSGSVTIDGTKYIVKDYKVTNETN